jgi:hypothetical protein
MFENIDIAEIVNISKEYQKSLQLAAEKKENEYVESRRSEWGGQIAQDVTELVHCMVAQNMTTGDTKVYLRGELENMYRLHILVDEMVVELSTKDSISASAEYFSGTLVPDNNFESAVSCWKITVKINLEGEVNV